jgi:predicted nucleic acid-binding Zn ribbon protein
VCTVNVYFVDRGSSLGPCSFDHCIVCTAYVYFVDRGSFFGPCSFDHCIVCTAYVYFVDRGSLQWSNEQGLKDEQRSTK